MTETDYKELAELLFKGEDLKTPEEYEALYPYRKLGNKAEVTRLAPSPTGYIHLGNLYSALADERIAHTKDGVFFLRIEDTDAKRKVDGAVELVIDALRYFGIEFDEGAGFPEDALNNVYGPFIQSERVSIYHTYAKKLVEEGKAYPCFATEEELAAVREQQEKNNELTGYYGKYAVSRNLELDEIKKNLGEGKPYVVRLKSEGSPDKEFEFQDEIKKKVKLPENIHDVVILKRDGIPTYHFAHVVDDHLMRTTLVLRGGEWLASLPIHIELFNALGWKPPKYAHTAHMMKIDEETGGKRKLSKRKDPEMGLLFYKEAGFHPECIKIYLMTLLNSNFEEWHKQNPGKSIEEFPFSVKHMNNSGALFDIDKLENICKNELSQMGVVELYNFLAEWAHEYEPEKKKVWFADENKFVDILMLLMGYGQKRRRKDLINAKQTFEQMNIFFNEFMPEREEFPVDNDTVVSVLKDYLTSYDYNDTNQEWFDKLGVIAMTNGFATDRKAYKEEPEKYKGDITTVATIVRIAVTGKSNTPDLWSINQIIGLQTMVDRVEMVIKELEAKA